GQHKPLTHLMEDHLNRHSDREIPRRAVDHRTYHAVALSELDDRRRVRNLVCRCLRAPDHGPAVEKTAALALPPLELTTPRYPAHWRRGKLGLSGRREVLVKQATLVARRPERSREVRHRRSGDVLPGLRLEYGARFRAQHRA